MMFVLVALFTFLLILFSTYKQLTNSFILDDNNFVADKYINISNISTNSLISTNNIKRSISGGEFALIENKKNIKPVVYRYNKWKSS